MTIHEAVAYVRVHKKPLDVGFPSAALADKFVSAIGRQRRAWGNVTCIRRSRLRVRVIPC